jgi:thiol-disulfide isomerase/thioredoxin
LPVLIAAVILVGLIGLVNLLFVLGVIRRLREHTEILNSLGVGQPVILPPGRTVADYRGITVDGQPVGSDLADSPTLVAFLSPSCEPCRAKLPGFLELAGNQAGGRETVLAVVVGDSDHETAALVTELGRVARVVLEPDGGALQKAFAVTGFPAFALLGSGGEIAASGSDVAAVSRSLQEKPSTVSVQHA